VGPQCLVLTVRFVNFTLKCTTKRTVRRCAQESIIMKLFPFYLFHRFYFGASTIPSILWNTHTHNTLLSWLEGNIRKSIKKSETRWSIRGSVSRCTRSERVTLLPLLFVAPVEWEGPTIGVIGKHGKGESELVQNWGYLTSPSFSLSLSLYSYCVVRANTALHSTHGYETNHNNIKNNRLFIPFFLFFLSFFSLWCCVLHTNNKSSSSNNPLLRFTPTTPQSVACGTRCVFSSRFIVSIPPWCVWPFSRSSSQKFVLKMYTATRETASPEKETDSGGVCSFGEQEISFLFFSFLCCWIHTHFSFSCRSAIWMMWNVK